jgi:hypothetical protein
MQFINTNNQSIGTTPLSGVSDDAKELKKKYLFALRDRLRNELVSRFANKFTQL